MTVDKHEAGSESRGRRRHRFGRFFSTTHGKAIGLSALLAPVVAFVANDLKKPDSVVRKLASVTVDRLLSSKWRQKNNLDISDKAKVTIEDEK